MGALKKLFKESDYHAIDRACEAVGPGRDSLNLVLNMLNRSEKIGNLDGDSVDRQEFKQVDTRCSAAEPLMRVLVQCLNESIPTDLDYEYIATRKPLANPDKRADWHYASALVTMRIDGLLKEISSKDRECALEYWLEAILSSDRDLRSKDFEMVLALRTYLLMGTLSTTRFEAIIDSNRRVTATNPTSHPFTNSFYSSLRSYKAVPLTADIDLGSFSKTSAHSSNFWIVEDCFVDERANRVAEAIQSSSLLTDALLKKGDLDALSDESFLSIKGIAGLTLPYLAYCGREPVNLRRLLKSGADVDVVLEEDVFPLVIDSEVQVYDPTFSPRRGETILLSAALDPFSKSDFLPLILPYTKKPDARDLLNRNALHRFLYHRVQEDQNYLIMLLIGAGADVNAKSVSGNTPCHVAVNRNAHLIKDLIGAGADFYAKNDRGETPMDLLKRSIDEKWIFHEKNAQVLKDLEERGLLKEKE